MKKSTFTLIAIAFMSVAMFAQQGKKIPPTAQQPHTDAQTKLSIHRKIAIPTTEDPFGVGEVNYQTLPTLTRTQGESFNFKVIKGENGLPIFAQGKTAESNIATSDTKAIGDQAKKYIESLHLEGLIDATQELEVTNVATDEKGNLHVRMQQMYQDIPVFGAEILAHATDGKFTKMNGRYFPTPTLSGFTDANLSENAALQVAFEDIGLDKVKTSWSAKDLLMTGGKTNEAILMIFHQKEALEAEQLVWVLTVRPNVMQRFIYFIDAKTGKILNKIDHTCQIDGGKSHQQRENGAICQHDLNHTIAEENTTVLAGAVPASGTDLLGQTRNFSAWQDGSVVYMEETSKTMFNASASQMPNEPIGTIVTIDAMNTSPENQSSFTYDIVVSNSATFNNPVAVSANWNSIKSYDYFKSTFDRNSIDGSGGNILAFVNVVESDGSSMENAFWNGEAMWYGNGGATFKKLARGLDVGGHEMTHGVVEKTANLVYQNESGALNESFADIFGAMIDRDDWKIGEDVMQSGQSPNGCLRSLEDPHNGAAQGTQWWQPKHVNEKYNGSQDNGGVHINSGIPNHAFYLFATNSNVGKDKAEKVYYKALKDYLIKSSKFVDCRIAVIQAATDLFGNTVATAAAAAFEAVGIGGSAPSGNYLGTLQPNPGDDYILCLTEDFQKLDLVEGNGTIIGTLYDQGLKSRPSVTDKGDQIVFVNAEGHIIAIDMVYNGSNITPTVNSPLSQDPIWRNAAISKDGRFLAAVANLNNQGADNKIYVLDLASANGNSHEFTLYNPTYTQGQTTGDVKYADVLEFDYSGKNLMYDSYTENINAQGQDLSYWDIGFLKFWENGNFSDGLDDISKLFGGLPEKSSIGNPTFAKNSPFVIAFDFIDNLNNKYDVVGANIETGDNAAIVSDNGDLGYPNYNRLDNAIIYDSEFLIFGKNLALQGVSNNKISSNGSSPSDLVSDHIRGVWYASGTRSLQVNTNEVGNVSSLVAVPNPVIDQLSIDFTAKTATKAQVSIVNLLGATLAVKEYQLNEGKNQLNIGLQSLPSGTYLVRVQAGKSASVVKVVKQ
jgi:Zn-dependent metalloprotease